MKGGFVLWLLWLGAAFPVFGLDARNYAVEATVEAQSSPPRLAISWLPTEANEYQIRRRPAGSSQWSEPIARLPGHATSYVDEAVSAGQAYEYEIQCATRHRAGDSRWATAYTYLHAGIDLPLVDAKGRVLLLVDSTVSAPLGDELNRYARDLIGAGWEVARREVSRTAPVSEVKSLIVAEYRADPSLRSVVLIGHVPVPYSGDIAPDLHETHRGAWPADLYYAELDGTWTDTTVNRTSFDNPDNHNRPGDGKFDQSRPPSAVDLEIGRIDFWGLPAFVPRSELDLLRNYFRKNHEFRHRVFTASRRGLVRDNFGDLMGDAPAVDAWRHFGGFFGPGNVREVPFGSFIPTLNSESFLWAYGGGGGSYTKADGVASTADFASNDPRAVFLILHGSYFGDWNVPDNFLRAAIATPGMTLASVWSGLPHWYLHPMALGSTIGYATRLSQNNWDDYKSHRNFAANEVHISLIGDPTLEMFPVIPPGGLSASGHLSVALSWGESTDENLAGYHVYFSGNANGPFQRLTMSPVVGASYSHSPGAGTFHYMVRAVKREVTGSGTFFNASQGVFATITTSDPPALPVVSISAREAIAHEAGRVRGTFQISRAPVAETPLTVEFLVGGTGTEGIDYEAIGSRVMIAGGESTALLVISPLDDELQEGDETVTVQLRPNGTYTIGRPPSALVTIQDRVVNQPPTIGAVVDVRIPANSATGEIPFPVYDPDTALDALTVRASSSDALLLPVENMVLGGSGGSRTIQLTPAANKSGSVTITLTVSDSALEASTSFTLTVDPLNEVPIALPSSVATNEDEPVEILLSGEDANGDPLTFRIISRPGRGTLIGTPPNLTYRPNSNEHGEDQFSFVVNDGELESDEAVVVIQITPVNDLPEISEIPAQIVGKNSSSGPIAFTVNDPDRPISGLVVEVHSSNLDLISSEGVQVSGEGSERSLVMEPATNATGTAIMTLIVWDGEHSAATSFEVTVVNHPPEPGDDEVYVLSGGDEIPVRDLLRNDSDPDGDLLSITAVTQGEAGGTVALSNGVVRFTAVAGGSEDTFSYTVMDTSGEAASARVQVRVVAAPAIRGIQVQSDGSAQLDVRGIPGRTFRALRSTDLANWTLIGEGVANSSGDGSFRDDQPGSTNARFYQIEW